MEISVRNRAASCGPILALCGLFLTASGCASTMSDTSLEIDRWATTADAPCVRFTVGWPVAVDLLQEIVGPNFAPARMRAGESDTGQLLLLFVNCPASRIGEISTGPLTAAHVVIPLSSGGASRVISGVPEDGWRSVPLTVAGAPVAKLFRRHGFTVVDGSAALSVTKRPAGSSVEASLLFTEGRITIQSSILADSVPLSRAMARVGTGVNLFAAFSGDESATRHSSGQAKVKMVGDTPLSDLQLGEIPSIVMFDENLFWDVTFWHEALSQE